jgi:hypothetical protein
MISQGEKIQMRAASALCAKDGAAVAAETPDVESCGTVELGAWNTTELEGGSYTNLLITIVPALLPYIREPGVAIRFVPDGRW